MRKSKTAGEKLLAFARRKAKQCMTWIELHNAVYGIGGKCVELMPTASERATFSKSAEYKAIAGLLAELPRTAGEPKAGDASGKFVVRIPPSMHTALIAEAEREDVSLNQLCVSKLAVQLRALV